MTSSHFYELLSTFPSWLQDDCHNSRHHILTHQCSKTGRKWGGWALFLLVSLLLKKKIKYFLDTQHISFYISYIQILIAREADIKIQQLVPLVAKRLCQQGEDQLNKNGDPVRSCWERVAGLHLTGCAATHTCSSLPSLLRSSYSGLFKRATNCIILNYHVIALKWYLQSHKL